MGLALGIDSDRDRNRSKRRVSPVVASNALIFSPAFFINPGAAVSLTVTAQTASGLNALTGRVVYAVMVELGGSDHRGSGLPMVGLMLASLRAS